MEANQEILIESDPSFYMRYLDIKVLTPCIEEGFNTFRRMTPHDVHFKFPCRKNFKYLFDFSVVFVICPIQHRFQSILNILEVMNVSYGKI